jgi:hypothetical protein
MVIRGVQVRFDCKNGEQFEAIGRFWDRMHVFCPGENLLGVGFGWKNDTLCYLIGTENGVPAAAEKIKEVFPQAEAAEIILPDTGWKTYFATADTLDVLYEEIYRDGPLTYEIERFDADDNAEVLIYRRGD